MRIDKRLFNIYKIRVYADGINILKSKYDGDPVQHNERAKEYLSFFAKLVKKLTGKPMSYFYLRCTSFHQEIIKELLKKDYGIIVVTGEEYNWWFVPKNNKELSSWVEENCKLPFKIVKRCPNFSSLDLDDEYYFFKTYGSGIRYNIKVKKPTLI